MAQIYDSTHSGQQVDAAVDAALTTIPAQLTQIGSELDELNGTSISVAKDESGWTWGKYCTPSGTLGDSANWGRKSFHLLAWQTIKVTTYGSGAGIITQTSDDVNFTLLASAQSGISGYNAYTYTAIEECDVTAFLRAAPTETKPTVEMSGKVDIAGTAVGTSYNNNTNELHSTNVQGALDEIAGMIGGRNIKGLDDFENLLSGYYLDVNNGVAKSNGAAMYATNDYYPLTKGDVLTYGLNGSAPWGLVCFYDADKNFKSAIAGQGHPTLVEGVHTTTDDLEYVRFCYLNQAVYIKNEYITITHNSIPRLKSAEEHIEMLDSRVDALEELDKDINGRQNAYPNKKLSDVTGIFDSETTFVTFPIPAKAGDIVRWNPITLNSTLGVYMNEYDNNGNRLGSWNNHTGVRDCTLSNSATAYIMATFFYEHQDEAKIYVNGVLAWSNPIFSQGQEERIEALENNIITNTGIVALNNPSETLLKFKQIKKTIYGTSGADTGIRQFTLLHFSDIHGIEANFQRIIDYYKAYQGYIDDVLHTGDAMAGNWANSFDFWANNADAASFLNCIGNHDTAYYTAEEGFDWTRYVGLDAYNRYFAPLISNWGVTQPTDAATNGYCYYYKDYSNSNVRLIVLDSMSIEKDGDSVQLSWFENVLADALAKGLHVVGAYHYSRIDTAIECAMQNVYKSNLPAEMPISLMDKVDAFIENGGNFVCWISGHTHRDYFGTYTCATYGHKIASVVVDTAAAISQPKFSDISRDSGTRGYDLFNIFSVDTYRKRFSVFRVGSNFDSVMRHIGSITYDYDNSVLLASY